MRRPSAALIIIISLLIAVPVFAGLIEDATEASKHGDYKTAYSLNKQLAEAGDAKAQFLLGAGYYSGEGVPQDYAEAMKWYRKAADQGHASAQYNLGILYAEGQGVPQDYVLAHMFFNLAVSRYPASEQDKRKKVIHNRDLAASKMTPAQIAEAQRLAREWKPKKER
jgi:TPR repeat protein